MIPISSQPLSINEQEKKTFLNEIPTSWLDAFKAGFSADVDQNPTWGLLRDYDRQRAAEEDSTLIPQYDLNKKYSGLGLTFYRDEPKGYVEKLVEQRLQELKLRDIQARGPQNFLAKTSYFLGSFGSTVVDPINIGAGFIPVVGQEVFLSKVAKSGLTAARFQKGIAEGFVGNLAVEPINILNAKSEQKEYTAYDSLRNITFGTIASGGLHVAFGRIGDAYKSVTGQENIYTKIANADPALREDMLKYSLGQLALGKKIDIQNFLDRTIIANEDNIKAASNTIEKPKDLIDLENEKTILLDNARKIDSTAVVNNDIIISKTKEQLKDENLKLRKELKIIQSQEIKPIIKKSIGKEGEEITTSTYDQTAINQKTKLITEKVQQIKELETKINKMPEQNNNLNILKTKLDVLNEKIDNVKTRVGIKNYENKIAENQINEQKPIKTTNIKDPSQLKSIENFEINGNIDRTKIVNSEDVNYLNNESNVIKDQIVPMENQLKKISEKNNSYIESVNNEIASLDKKINRQSDLLKSIQAGVSCIFRKGL
jgi:hypothetical protein